jgi:hypothetical protein
MSSSHFRNWTVVRTATSEELHGWEYMENTNEWEEGEIQIG